MQRVQCHHTAAARHDMQRFHSLGTAQTDLLNMHQRFGAAFLHSWTDSSQQDRHPKFLADAITAHDKRRLRPNVTAILGT